MNLTLPVDSNDRIHGPADASVTLVEFGDYQCSYCGSAQPIVEALNREFSGNLRFVFRNFPITELHPDAMNAALVAESASTADFWALHDALFANQAALDPESLIALAASMGVSPAKARTGLNGSTRSKIERDLASGAASGLQGTPTFFINGRLHEGEWSQEVLGDALRQAGA